MRARTAEIHSYTFDAAVHCVACTVARFGVNAPPNSGRWLDGNTIPLDAKDSEGNAVRPVFVWDEREPRESCGTCREVLS